MDSLVIKTPSEPAALPAFLAQFELWARTDQGLQESMMRKHPLPDEALYLDRIVDALWRGFKGYRELVQRGDA
ncbi:hypothetical protein PQR64_23325 [Paraburkholderia phytofirmans]|uniref:hypothetical protein n=1 Tax=Paraburkholderia phytofirmans TaxID=261302 RepID=UPI0038BAB6B3